MTQESSGGSRRQFIKSAGVATTVGGFVGLSGCLGGSGGGDSGSIKIGMLLPTSGPLAQAGTDSIRGAEIRTESINDEGGIDGKTIETVEKDTEGTPETGTSRARQLVTEEDVDIIMGLVSSSVAKAVSEFTATQDVPLMVTAAQTPDLNHQECKTTTFRTNTNTYHHQRATAHVVDEMTDATRVAGINPDYVYGTQSWDVFQSKYEELNPDVEFVSEQFPAFQKGDYRKEIQATLDADPDVVHSVLYAGDMISFMQQAKQYDFFQQVDEFILGAIPMQVTLAMGSEMPEVLSVDRSYYAWPESNERRQKFTEEYRSRHDTIPSIYSLETSAALTALKEAVEKSGGTSTDDIVNGLQGLSFSSVVPDMTVREADNQGIRERQIGGRIGPLEDESFYGFTDIVEVSSENFVDEPTCEF